MKKIILTIPVAGAVATVIGLGVSSIKPWKWENTASKHQINYCLLIGQTDHNDSQARTAGVREALHTRPEHAADSNPNTETPVKGELEFTLNKTGDKVKYEVNELESKTCIADSGDTWDQSTAIKISNTWYSKYENNLTMIISNNDGMAEGALFSLFRPDGMPIFGYDSNASTVQLIKEKKIQGTINSNAPAQAAAINILARRLIDGISLENAGGHLVTKSDDETGIKITYENGYKYDYSKIYEKLFKGFKFGEGVTSHPSDTDDNFIAKGSTAGGKGSGYITDFTSEHKDITFSYGMDDHALLVSSNIVNQDNYVDFTKSVDEQSGQSNVVNTPAKSGKSYNFFNCSYSKSNTYLKSTFLPLYDNFKKTFNIPVNTVYEGNGNDEKETLNAIPSTPQDAYIINMTKTNNADKYIDKIKGVVGDDYVKTPIIFYNRQPTTSKGQVEKTWLDPKTNGGNPFVFYVGFDAVAGANAQGEMVTEWLKTQVGASSVK